MAGASSKTVLADLAPPQRLAIGLFLLLLLGFYGLAQVKLVTSGGTGSVPGPAAVLVKYRGDPTKTRLHAVLDPALPTEHPLAMWPHLGRGDAVDVRRARLLAWAEAGAPASEWPEVAPIFQGEAETPDAPACGTCHLDRSAEGGHPRTERSPPFDTYEDVKAALRPDTGMSLHDLATSSHNHMMGFAVVSFLVSIVFSFTRWRGAWVAVPIVAAFVGPAVDVGSWWLTRAHGAPFQWGVIAGGALFGASVLWMIALSLDELWLRGAVGRTLRGVLRVREDDVVGEAR
jgi:hypothetical protein